MPVDGSEAGRVAIVDYGMGNLFSVQRACEQAGLQSAITSDASALLEADGVILPGVGAFGEAMAALTRLDLVHVLRDVCQRGTPVLSICLGMQLLMTESHEFGRHRGLGVIAGEVIRFANPMGPQRPLKVPQVGWNIIRPNAEQSGLEQRLWNRTLLEGLRPGEYMYFVHSYHVLPEDPSVRLSVSDYGDIPFCSALGKNNVTGCQFHPEKSGPAGLQVFANLAAAVARAPKERGNACGLLRSS